MKYLLMLPTYCTGWRPTSSSASSSTFPNQRSGSRPRAGASARQLYTALIYGGMGLVGEITHGLDALLACDGHDSVASAVGTDRAAWLG